MGVGSAKITTEKRKHVTGECEMDAHGHGMGATEGKNSRCHEKILGMPKPELNQKKNKNKSIVGDISILILCLWAYISSSRVQN
jgi:hypothetical protein